jgi:F-type H+-transporting ATPase subunit epsilon
VPEGGGFRISVVTPEQILLDGAATAVVLRSSDGDLTVLDGHTPLITDVVPGPVRVEREEAETVHIAVHGGYLQVEKGVDDDGSEGPGTRVTVLAGVAELAGDIDVARAEEARDRARERVDQLRAAGARDEVRGSAAGVAGTVDGGGPAVTPEDVELIEAEAALRRAEVRLDVAGASV